MWLGHDPYQISFRHALIYNEHSEAVLEHRAAIIQKAIADAFGNG